MNILSESIKIETKHININKIYFEKEYPDYNYTFRVRSDSITYPMAFIYSFPSEENQNKQKLSIAAKKLYSDYKENDELTIFATLDTEDFL